MIPTAFLFSTIGYPFILPDMIGGNVYNNEALPSKVGKTFLYVPYIPARNFGRDLTLRH